MNEYNNTYNRIIKMKPIDVKDNTHNFSLTKNADVNKYKYSGYGIAFDRTSSFSFPGGGNGQNVIISAVDINSSIHVDNKGKDILIL